MCYFRWEDAGEAGLRGGVGAETQGQRARARGVAGSQESRAWQPASSRPGMETVQKRKKKKGKGMNVSGQSE